MDSISEIIKKRRSCRSYSDRSIEDKILHDFFALVESPHIGPFGNRSRFKLISANSMEPAEWKRLGTYGVIKNARLFLAGIMKKDKMAEQDYGYCKEKLILKATGLGLGTCWMGGTFSGGAFARAACLQNDELLPTVSPVGYPADQKSLTDKVMRRFAGSDHRKPWSEIFFAGNLSTPLNELQAGKYAQMLENVRLAPSASNKQPWRILCDSSKKVFHFYLARTFGYKMIGQVSLQDIDLGIAMSHFGLTAEELGLVGRWRKEDLAPEENSLEYIVSWQEKV
jgi:nitroreductase